MFSDQLWVAHMCFLVIDVVVFLFLFLFFYGLGKFFFFSSLLRRILKLGQH